MSLESLIASEALKKGSDNFLLNSLEKLNSNIERLVESQPQPFIFLKTTEASLSSNVANGEMILAGSRVKDGHRATVKDFNLHFATQAGTVRIVVLDENN